MKRLRGVVCFVIAGLPLLATTVPRLTLEEMVERSEVIVHGKCLRSWSAWDAGHQIIWTHHEVQVSEPLKGAAGRTIVVSEPGGRVDDMELIVEGMPRYEPGEEMVVFLYRVPNGLWRARGLGQGKFAVRPGPDGSLRITGDLQGAALLEPAGAATGRETDLRRLDGTSLQSFKSTVRALASASGRERK